MKRLSVLVLAVLFACLLVFDSSYAQVGAEGDTGTTVQGSAASPPTPAGSSGQWVQVPGESVGGRWVPPHWVWVSSPAGVQPRPLQYAPVPAYVVGPPLLTLRASSAISLSSGRSALPDWPWAPLPP